MRCLNSSLLIDHLVNNYLQTSVNDRFIHRGIALPRFWILFLSPLLDRPEGESTNQLFLSKPAKDHDRGDREERCRRQLRPEKPLRT